MKTRTNDEKLDLFADLLEPCAAILSDKEVADAFQNGTALKAITKAIRGHKREMVEILAVLDGEDPSTYSVNVLMIPVRFLKLMNDPATSDAIRELFTLQAQNGDGASSGPAMEVIPGGGQ